MGMNMNKNACRFLILCGLLFLFTTTLQASESHPLEPADTSSPRATLRSFQKIMGEYGDLLRGDMYMLTQGSVLRDDYLDKKAGSCLNLNNISKERVNDVDDVAIVLLQEVLDRIELPPYEKIPDTTLVQNEKLSRWTIPRTEITIAKVKEGKREGEWLFSQETVANTKIFYEKVKELPYRPDAVVGSIGTLGGLYAYRVFLPEESFPSEWLDHMPAWTRTVYLEHPVWKLLAIVLILVSGCLIFALILIAGRRIRAGRDDDETRVLWWKFVLPVGVMAIAFLADELIDEQIDALGVIDEVTETGLWLVMLICSAWALLRLGDLVAHTISLLPKMQTKKENVTLIHIFFRVLSLIVGTWLIVEGLDRFGLSVVPLFAGLGVGGLAVALAIRPTLENLIGGVILYLDHPVHVGDYCSFGDKAGTVEQIGIRTIKIRGLDRTLITIPNAEFANKELINWAECDTMLITTTFGLRYETDSDQLRHVLVKIREMFHAHPKIDGETVRIRLSDFGPSSFEINVRVYALTRDWNEFFAIREDVFLHIKDIVSTSGANFALPSRTLHMTRDRSMDSERGEAAASEVKAWRRSGQLPFPTLSAERIAELQGTLDWPPRGSFDSNLVEPESAEPLSSDDIEEEHDESERR